MDNKPPLDVRMKGFRERADVSEMWCIIDERIGPLTTETINIHVAAGRSLASPVHAPFAIPRFPRAAMDGYAVRGEDTYGAAPFNELPLRVIGQSLPGAPSPATVGRNQAVRIMTGAPVPDGADAVLMAEYCREEADIVYVSDAVAPGKNIGRVGEDIQEGTTVLSPPRILRPQDLAVSAALGIDSLTVYRRPKVDILVTGNELLPSGSKPMGCQIVDTNSLMLRALVERDGGVVNAEVGQPIPILADDRETIRKALIDSTADCILVSGGSSVGREDHAPMLLAELGELTVHGLALRPASPAGMGFLASKPVFLIPGNPVSCLCAYDFFAGRAVRLLGGRPVGWPYPRRTLPLERKISSQSGRVDYVRVRITAHDTIEPLAISGASVLSSTTRADGFVVVPKDLEGYAAGTLVDVWLFDTQSQSLAPLNTHHFRDIP